MKFRFSFLLAFTALVLSLASCGGSDSQNHDQDHQQDTSKVDTTANAQPKGEEGVLYYCPMKCEGEKQYHQAGECVVCEMDLRKVK